MVTELDRELSRIIVQAQSGDVSAFGDLYNRYAAQILRYLYARTHDQEVAQDLTQEVFVRVLKGISSFEYRGEKSFLGWLYSIAANVLISQVRRKQPVSTPLDDGIDVIDPCGQDAVHALFDRMTLKQAIEQLTDDQQQVLTLKFFADLTNGEIAAVLGRTEGAIKALQHRALQTMALLLQRERMDYRALAVNAHADAADDSIFSVYPQTMAADDPKVSLAANGAERRGRSKRTHPDPQRMS